jgi:hypothetical protein
VIEVDQVEADLRMPRACDHHVPPAVAEATPARTAARPP